MGQPRGYLVSLARAAARVALGAPVRTFVGFRPNPPDDYVKLAITNASTQEPDYEGVIFSDGTVVVRWLTEYQSHSVWASWDDFMHVHGHPEYGTQIIFADVMCK